MTFIQAFLKFEGDSKYEDIIIIVYLDTVDEYNLQTERDMPTTIASSSRRRLEV